MGGGLALAENLGDTTSRRGRWKFFDSFRDGFYSHKQIADQLSISGRRRLKLPPSPPKNLVELKTSSQRSDPRSHHAPVRAWLLQILIGMGRACRKLQDDGCGRWSARASQNWVVSTGGRVQPHPRSGQLGLIERNPGDLSSIRSSRYVARARSTSMVEIVSHLRTSVSDHGRILWDEHHQGRLKRSGWALILP